MKYENAADILPEDLLKRVQKFAAGKLIYVPETIGKRSWGETSGYKRYLAARNQEIKEKFLFGFTVEKLADEYSLSVESIKKIVYSKSENKELKYRCSLSSAKEFSEAGKLEEWVHLFLLSDGHNKAFSDGLKLFDRYYLGPFTMPLSLFSRCCGPEENIKYQVNAEWFEKRVQSLMKTLQSNDDIPPLIVHFVDHGFELCDGNHRFEALTRLGVKEYPVIVWMTEKEEYDEFSEVFAKFLTK
ncbi:MAG: ParB-like nuclease domain-containing protein [Clostridia bacterium]|nr:ParB-like nuclease domain-containing protein [Clostridia bacterium]